MERIAQETRLNESYTAEIVLDETVMEHLENLYQMIHNSLVMTVTSIGDHELKLEARLDTDTIDRVSDQADVNIADLEQAAAFVEQIKKEDMRMKSIKELYALLWKELKGKIGRLVYWKQYRQITDRSENHDNAHHALRMTFLRTLLLMANVRRRQAKQAMTDGE